MRGAGDGQYGAAEAEWQLPAPASVDEYVGEHKDDEDSDDEDIEDNNLEDDAPNTTLQTKGKEKGGRKKAVQKREEVQRLRNQHEKAPENDQSLKRKSSSPNPGYSPSHPHWSIHWLLRFLRNVKTKKTKTNEGPSGLTRS